MCGVAHSGLLYHIRQFLIWLHKDHIPFWRVSDRCGEPNRQEVASASKEGRSAGSVTDELNRQRMRTSDTREPRAGVHRRACRAVRRPAGHDVPADSGHTRPWGGRSSRRALAEVGAAAGDLAEPGMFCRDLGIAAARSFHRDNTGVVHHHHHAADSRPDGSDRGPWGAVGAGPRLNRQQDGALTGRSMTTGTPARRLGRRRSHSASTGTSRRASDKPSDNRVRHCQTQYDVPRH